MLARLGLGYVAVVVNVQWQDYYNDWVGVGAPNTRRHRFNLSCTVSCQQADRLGGYGERGGQGGTIGEIAGQVIDQLKSAAGTLLPSIGAGRESGDRGQGEQAQLPPPMPQPKQLARPELAKGITERIVTALSESVDKMVAKGKASNKDIELGGSTMGSMDTLAKGFGTTASVLWGEIAVLAQERSQAKHVDWTISVVPQEKGKFRITIKPVEIIDAQIVGSGSRAPQLGTAWPEARQIAGGAPEDVRTTQVRDLGVKLQAFAFSQKDNEFEYKWPIDEQVWKQPDLEAVRKRVEQFMQEHYKTHQATVALETGNKNYKLRVKISPLALGTGDGEKKKKKKKDK